MWEVTKQAARGCVATGVRFGFHRFRAGSHAASGPDATVDSGSIRLHQ